MASESPENQVKRCVLLAAILLVTSVPALAQHDLVITNARVVDGTGSPWFRADVAVRDGKIAAVGDVDTTAAARVVDARGRILAPGFIDVHTHIEAGRTRGGIEARPVADNFLFDGVTTLVTGNCGGSETDLGRWFEKIEGLGLGVNVASLIGHNSVRREVMGEANRKPTSEELARMKSLVERAMEDGAVGFSTGLLYVPGTYAETSEVIALAEVAARHGGVYASHIREQGAKLLESITEAVTVGREAGMPVQISHLKIKGRTRWGTIGEALDLIERYRAEGVDVVVDVYPYERASTALSVTMPAWALADGHPATVSRIQDTGTRERIEREMRAMLDDGGYPDYGYATVASYPPDPSLAGKSIREINVERGREPTVENEIRTILEMMIESNASMIYHFMSMEDVEAILRYRNAAVASDGSVREPGVGKPHPRSYGTNARVLADLVRERKVLPLEEAVRRMTSLPARTFSLLDRGLVRPGFVADLVLFDLDRVQDEATFEEPHQPSEGFDLVVVHGVPVVDEEGLGPARPGRVLRHGERR